MDPPFGCRGPFLAVNPPPKILKPEVRICMGVGNGGYEIVLFFGRCTGTKKYVASFLCLNSVGRLWGALGRLCGQNLALPRFRRETPYTGVCGKVPLFGR